jgi:hypothetical protein
LPEGAIDDLAEHLKLLNTEYIERDESGKSD